MWEIKHHILSLDTIHYSLDIKHIFLYLSNKSTKYFIFCNYFEKNLTTIKTKFKDGVFMPLENVKEVKVGDIVDIEIKTGKKFSWKGLGRWSVLAN
ncbi:MAG: hypothetical protein GY941_15035 [Planctomycetes bacterium]|nr:hypothetical protein [Planctomycetota bacterium]